MKKTNKIKKGLCYFSTLEYRSSNIFNRTTTNERFSDKGIRLKI